MSVTTGTVSSQVTDAHYLQSAQKNYDEGDMSSCLIFLNHVTGITERVASLTTDAAFQLWKSIEADSYRRDQHVNLILTAFTRVLDCGVHSFMLPLDYLRLAHIYISQGALDSGLRILQLASARGHFENVVIIISSWIIMKQFSDRGDLADSQMNYITSALVQSHLHPNDAEIGGMRLEYIMLFCANHLRMKFLSTTREKLKKPAYDTFRAVLTELYILATKNNPTSMKVILDWFDDSELWMSAGRSLEGTPFGILMSEECYWQGFLRKPLDPVPLDLILASMRRNHREDWTRRILERAIRVSPWHLGCRAGLCDIDEREEVPYMLSWVRVFDGQELQLCKIQAWIRGVLVRIWWKTGRVDVLLRKQQALKKQQRSGKAFLIQRDRRKLQLFRQWKDYVVHWKELKRRSAVVLQVFWRRVWAMYVHAWARYRVRRANCLFLIAVQHKANTHAMRIFRGWQDAANKSKLRRSANTIIAQLKADKSFQVFHKYVTLLTQLRRIRGRIYDRSSWRAWMKIFRGRQRKHAMMSIRFYVRNNYKMQGQPKKETKAEQQVRLQLAEERVFKALVLNPVPHMRRAWKAWRFELWKRRSARAKIAVAKLLPRLWRRAQARAKVRAARVRLEALEAGQMRLSRLGVRKVYDFIRRLAVVLRLQRFIRCALSRRKLRFLQDRERKVAASFQKKCLKLVKRVLQRWQRALYLIHRERLRARRRIKRCFDLATCKRVTQAAVGRKYFVVCLLFALHRRLLKKRFRTLKMNTIIQYQIDTLIPFCTALSRFHLRHNMRKWRMKLHEQDLLLGLIRVFVLQPIDSKFWKGAHVSVAESSAVQHRPAWVLRRPTQLPAARPASASSTSSDSDALLEWERVVPPSYKCFQLRHLRRIRAFRTWMAMYRQRCRDRRGGSQALVALVLPVLMDQVWLRLRARMVLQAAFRVRLAVRRVHRKRHLVRMAEERYWTLHTASLRAIIRALRWLARACVQARLLLQRCLRGMLGRRIAAAVRRQQSRLRKVDALLQSSQLRPFLTRSVMGSWLTRFAMIKAQQLKACLGTVGEAGTSDAFGLARFAGASGSRHWSCLTLRNNCLHAVESLAALESSSLKSSIEDPKEGQSNRLLLPVLGHSSSNVYTGAKSLSFSLPGPLAMPRSNSLDSLGQQHGHGVGVGVGVGSGSKATKATKAKAKAVKEAQRLHTLRVMNETQNKFQSHVFNARLFQLRQTGVFVLSVDDDLLLKEETLFFVSNCETLFVQNAPITATAMTAASLPLQPLSKAPVDQEQGQDQRILASYLCHFKGRKVIICGGTLQAEEGVLVLNQLAKQTAVHALTLHLTHVRLSGEMVLLLAALLQGFSAPTEPAEPAEFASASASASATTYASVSLSSHSRQLSYKLRIKELFVDSDSIGPLGLTFLVHSWGESPSIEAFVISFTASRWFAGFAECLARIGNCRSLQELRLLGAPLGRTEAQALIVGLQSTATFINLNLLEVCIDGACSEGIAFSESIIQTCKRRGVSVLVKS